MSDREPRVRIDHDVLGTLYFTADGFNEMMSGLHVTCVAHRDGDRVDVEFVPDGYDRAVARMVVPMRFENRDDPTLVWLKSLVGKGPVDMTVEFAGDETETGPGTGVSSG